MTVRSAVARGKIVASLTPRTVRVPTIAHAATSARYPTSAAARKSSAPVCRYSALVPVTTVPTGKVNDHHGSPNGSPARAVRTVTAAGEQRPQQREAPSTGRP